MLYGIRLIYPYPGLGDTPQERGHLGEDDFATKGDLVLPWDNDMLDTPLGGCTGAPATGCSATGSTMCGVMRSGDVSGVNIVKC